MVDPVSWLVAERGWRVVTSDGSDVGRVDEVLGDREHDIFDGLVVSKGLLAHRRYVPAEIVAAISEGQVQLSLSSAAAKQLEEYHPPRS